MKLNKKELCRLIDLVSRLNTNVFKFQFSIDKENKNLMRSALINNTEFEIDDKLKEKIINAFIKRKMVINESTPEFIKSNEGCVQNSIEKDINSIEYILNESDNIKKLVIKTAITNSYIINSNSPKYLKNNVDVIISSINRSPISANSVMWDSLKENDIERLVSILSETDYTINNLSPDFLKYNKKIILNSINNNPNSIYFVPEALRNDVDIFKALFLNNYYNKNDLYVLDNCLMLFKDPKMLDWFFKEEVYMHVQIEEKDNYEYFIKSILNNNPLIKNYYNFFELLSEIDWNVLKKDPNNNDDNYQNMFGKICGYLQKGLTYEEAINEMNFMDNIMIILNERFQELDNSMREYFEIFHDNNLNNKKKLLKKSKDNISYFSSLYISKSKEIYKKQRIDEYMQLIKKYYKINTNNPEIKRILYFEKQRREFEHLLLTKDESVLNLIKSIKEKNNFQISEYEYKDMIYNYIVLNQPFENYMDIPSRYEEYNRFIKISKLVNRLNSNYIKYDGEEVKKYLKYIKFDQKTNSYYFDGDNFNELELNSFNEYNKTCTIYNKINKDIMLYMKDIIIDEKIDDSLLSSLENNLKFNDNNYIFSWDYFFKKTEYKNFRELSFDICRKGNLDNLDNDDIFKYIYDFTNSNNLLILYLIINNYEHKINYGDIKYGLIEKLNEQMDFSEYLNLISNFEIIYSKLINKKIDYSNIAEILKVSNLNIYSDNRDVALLGENLIDKLNKYRGYTSSQRAEIVNKAVVLYSNMVKREKSTIPYVFGEDANYKYSTFDHLDENILLVGITMDSCFRVDGNDNDFLHYCALDKNGVVIKITDEYDNLVGRAAGFRNGNCVFFNQLRTINDEGGVGYVGIHKTEQDQIKKVFELACKDIVSTSQYNLKEADKIDYVFITRSYAYEDSDNYVPRQIERKIGDTPMDNESEDWDLFIYATSNLYESHNNNYFYTDYGKYNIVCLASSKPLISSDDIIFENVRACYERNRSDVLVGYLREDNLKKVNKINAIRSIHEKNDNFEEISEDSNQIAISGDNWYVILNDNKEIIKECVLSFDKKARKEIDSIKEKISSIYIDQENSNIKRLVI